MIRACSTVTNMPGNDEIPALQLEGNILTAINDAVTEALQNQQQQFQQIAVNAAATALNAQSEKVRAMKRKLEETNKLKNVRLTTKSCKSQYNHNIDVLDNIDEALESIEEADIEACKEALNKGRKAILKRLKVIKIADREDWLVANEYLSDQLVSDAEDEKRLQKAINTANSKREKSKKAKMERPNHYKPRLREENEGASSSLRSADDFYCYRCYKKGHFAAKCPTDLSKEDLDCTRLPAITKTEQ